MICNIIDRRPQPYRWKRVNAIIEATWHDNAVPDADQAAEQYGADYTAYAEIAKVSVTEAVEWATRASGDCPVTLYLYDESVELSMIDIHAVETDNAVH